MSDLIEHLIEIDRRKLYLEEACASLSSYCIERLGHSEDEAGKRVRVTRLAARFPAVLDGLRSGAFHLSGVYLLTPYVTAENHAELLAEARGLSKRALEVLIARRFPKPDAPERLSPVPVQGMLNTTRPGGAQDRPKRWFGVGGSRKRRASASGTRRVPVHVARVVWFRDGNQCVGAAHIASKRAARRACKVRKTPGGEQPARSDERAGPGQARSRTEPAHTDGASTSEVANSDGASTAPANAEEALTAEVANSDGAWTAVQGALRTLGFTQADISNVTVALGTMNVVREREALLRAALQMLTPERQLLRSVR